MRACRELRTIPGVRNCGSHIGQAFLSDEPYGIYFGENWISVDPKVDYDRTLASVQEVVSGYPGIRRDVQTYLKERIREVLTGSSDAIVVRINGDDLKVLESKAEEVLKVMEGVDGLIEPKVELHKAIPQVVVKVNLAAAQRYGVKPGDVRRASATWFASEEVGDVFRGGRAYDVHVWSAPESRNSLTSVRELPIDTPSGKVIPLSARGRRPHRGDAQHDRAREPHAPPRGECERERARSRVGGGRPGGPPRGRRASRSATTPRCWASSTRHRQRRGACSSTASVPRSRSSCCCKRPSGAGVSRRCRS